MSIKRGLKEQFLDVIKSIQNHEGDVLEGLTDVGSTVLSDKIELDNNLRKEVRSNIDYLRESLLEVQAFGTPEDKIGLGFWFLYDFARMVEVNRVIISIIDGPKREDKIFKKHIIKMVTAMGGELENSKNFERRDAYDIIYKKLVNNEDNIREQVELLKLISKYFIDMERLLKKI